MMKVLKAFACAKLETKIFWIVSVGLAFMVTALCVYPYIWLSEPPETDHAIVEVISD